MGIASLMDVEMVRVDAGGVDVVDGTGDRFKTGAKMSRRFYRDVLHLRTVDTQAAGKGHVERLFAGADHYHTDAANS